MLDVWAVLKESSEREVAVVVVAKFKMNECVTDAFYRDRLEEHLSIQQVRIFTMMFEKVRTNRPRQPPQATFCTLQLRTFTMKWRLKNINKREKNSVIENQPISTVQRSRSPRRANKARSASTFRS